MWQIEHILAKVPAKKAVQKTRQADRGDDRVGTRRTKQLESLQNSKKTLSEVLTRFLSILALCYPKWRKPVK